jgi:para-nitrobenzyl esterase
MPGAAKGRLYDQINHDAFYRAPTLRAAEAHAAGKPGKTWHYQLECKSAVPGLDGIHAIDVALLFPGGPVRKLVNENAETERVSGLMLEAWTSFARTGAPRATGLPEWTPFGADRSTMVFDQPARLEKNLDAHLLGYW